MRLIRLPMRIRQVCHRPQIIMIAQPGNSRQLLAIRLSNKIRCLNIWPLRYLLTRRRTHSTDELSTSLKQLEALCESPASFAVYDDIVVVR
jgi:hypothetical protein